MTRRIIASRTGGVGGSQREDCLDSAQGTLVVLKASPISVEAVCHRLQTKAETLADEPKPGAGVVDGQQHAISVAAQLDHHLPVWAGRPGRIAHQIGYCAAKLDRIP